MAKAKRKKPPTLVKPGDLFAQENYPFWRQQVDLWAKHLLAGDCDMEFLGTEESELEGAFRDKDTPHDFVERTIQKFDMIRPDPIEAMDKPRPECPYHVLNVL